MNTKLKTMTGRPFLVVAGPCVIEDESLTLSIARELKSQLTGLPIEFVFKASFDKANRTSVKGFRGPGIERGIEILNRVKHDCDLTVLTDIHTPDQASLVAETLDWLQIPAFLCRQTDLVVGAAEAAARKGRKLNVKKGQFLAPWDAKNIVEKVREVAPELLTGNRFWLTERGVSFGYNQLVVDMSGFAVMQQSGVPVMYDATHSVQTPGAGPSGQSTGGKRENIEVLARAAVAAGANGIFIEVHPEPSKAKSDGPNAFYLDRAGAFIRQLLEINQLVSSQPKLLKSGE